MPMTPAPALADLAEVRGAALDLIAHLDRLDDANPNTSEAAAALNAAWHHLARANVAVAEATAIGA